MKDARNRGKELARWKAFLFFRFSPASLSFARVSLLLYVRRGKEAGEEGKERTDCSVLNVPASVSMSLLRALDVAVVGEGVVGCSTALALLEQHSNAKVTKALVFPTSSGDGLFRSTLRPDMQLRSGGFVSYQSHQEQVFLFPFFFINLESMESCLSKDSRRSSKTTMEKKVV